MTQPTPRANPPSGEKLAAVHSSVARACDAADALWSTGHDEEGWRLALRGLRLAVEETRALGGDANAEVAQAASETDPEPEAQAGDVPEAQAGDAPEAHARHPAGRSSDLDHLRAFGLTPREMKRVELARGRARAVMGTPGGPDFRAVVSAARTISRRLEPLALSPVRRRMRQARRRSAAAFLAICVVAAAGYFTWERIEEARAPWRAEYFGNQQLRGEAVEGIAAELQFDWGQAAPRTSIPVDHFSARFQTCLDTPSGGRLAIGVGSDDGARVFVDSEPILDAWRPQPMQWNHGEKVLEPGVHHIRVEYFDATGAGKLQVRLRVDGQRVDNRLVRPSTDEASCP